MLCSICPRHCDIAPGKTGACRARTCITSSQKAADDRRRYDPAAGEPGEEASLTVTALNYGKITAAALDPIEKKPLQNYKPGSMILSVGSFGCNLTCPFCQNHRISMTDNDHGIYKEINPYQLLNAAEQMKEAGNIGIAFTYNEPLIGYEYVLDCAKLFKKAEMDVVLVTNGYICEEPLKELLEYTDAMNIDLKAFNNEFYHRISGDLETVKHSIELASEKCHVEVTTLIIPGENDSKEEMNYEAEWLAGVGRAAGKDIPLHISRFFPAYDYADRKATDISLIYELADIARCSLKYVYTGNC